MRKLILLLVLLAPSAYAQQATIDTPIARSSIAKYKVDLFYFKRGGTALFIDVIQQDSSNVDIPNGITRFSIPSAAGSPCTSATSINGLAGAMNTARGGEPAGAAAAQQYRQLGYLIDQGCLTGVTLSNAP